MESLVVKDLKTYYHTYKGYNHAVDGVSFSLEKGEIFGLIGESGCGKSTIGNSLMKMIQFPGEIVGGSVLLGENDLVQKSGAELRKLLWKEIAMVPQSAMNAMNPCHKVGKQIMEAISLHMPELSKQQVRERMEELLVSVGLNKKWADAFPHKLSGGMKIDENTKVTTSYYKNLYAHWEDDWDTQSSDITVDSADTTVESGAAAETEPTIFEKIIAALSQFIGLLLSNVFGIG